MNARPLIAIVGRRSASAPILRFSATLAAEAMCEAVFAGGGEPAVLHGVAADPSADLSSRLSRFDGLLLPGGADLGPEWYGEERVKETVGIVDFQDKFDIAATRAYLSATIPALAICRGLQVLNVVCGGTLFQHLSETTVPHGSSLHEIRIARGTRLASIMGAEPVTVSSYHHQAVKGLGRGLVPTAHAEDGCIEAVEHKTADVVAVQWHPEDLHQSTAHDAALFADLAERASRRSRDAV